MSEAKRRWIRLSRQSTRSIRATASTFCAACLMRRFIIRFFPSFVGLYKFSNFDRDMSNSTERVWEHFTYLINELMRLTKPGRICSVHVMNLPRTKTRDGAVGMYDFRGDDPARLRMLTGYITRKSAFSKTPLIAQQRTRAFGCFTSKSRKTTISGRGLRLHRVVSQARRECRAGRWHVYRVARNQAEGESWSRVNTSAGLDISREAHDRQCGQDARRRPRAVAVRYVGVRPGLAAVRLAGLDGHRPDQHAAISQRPRRKTSNIFRRCNST